MARAQIAATPSKGRLQLPVLTGSYNQIAWPTVQVAEAEAREPVAPLQQWWLGRQLRVYLLRFWRRWLPQWLSCGPGAKAPAAHQLWAPAVWFRWRSFLRAAWRRRCRRPRRKHQAYRNVGATGR